MSNSRSQWSPLGPNQEKGRGGEDNSDELLDFRSLLEVARLCQAHPLAGQCVQVLQPNCTESLHDRPMVHIQRLGADSARSPPTSAAGWSGPPSAGRWSARPATCLFRFSVCLYAMVLFVFLASPRRRSPSASTFSPQLLSVFPHITVGFLFSCLHPAGRRPPSSAVVRRRALSHTHHKTYLIIHKSCHIIHNSSHITHHSSHTQLISHNTHLTHTHHKTYLIQSHTQLISHTSSHTSHHTPLISRTHTHITKLIIHTPHLIHHITHHSSHTHTHTSQNLSHHTQVISHHTQLIPHTAHLTHNSSHRQCVAGAVRRAA